MVAVFSSLPGLLTRLATTRDRKSTRLNSSHDQISYAVFCLKKKKRLTHLGAHVQERARNQPARHVQRETPAHDRTAVPVLRQGLRPRAPRAGRPTRQGALSA